MRAGHWCPSLPWHAVQSVACWPHGGVGGSGDCQPALLPPSRARCPAGAGASAVPSAALGARFHSGTAVLCVFPDSCRALLPSPECTHSGAVSALGPARDMRGLGTYLQAPLVQVGWPALVGTAASAWEREVETVPPVSCAQVKGDPLTSGLGSFPVAAAPGCKPAGFRLEHRGSLPAAPAQRGRLWEKCLQSRSPSPQSLQVLLLMLSVVRAPPHLPELGWEPLRGGSSVSGASATADWPTGLSLNCAGCLFTWERGTEMRSPRFPPTDRSYTAAPGAPTSPLLAAKQCPRPSSVRRSCWPGRHLRESRAPCCPLGS